MSSDLPDTPLPDALAEFPNKLVVSIHDVCPSSQKVVQWMIKELEAIGIARVSLLVVPNYHHQGHFLENPEFCDWLRTQAAAGHEIVPHGYYHVRTPNLHESTKSQFTNRYYTDGEGEFYDISGAVALRVISQTRSEFRQIGLEPKGFIAPAWLLSDGADKALQHMNIGYTTRLGSVYNYLTGEQHSSQSLVWSTRSFWRRRASQLWNASLFRRLKKNPLMRIGIHPPDARYRGVWKQIKKLAAKALRTRTATTYAGYLNLP